jgi:hypothetical protein
MNNKFDELARNMAQSVTRRGALKKFSVGVAGIPLAWLGLTARAEAAKGCASGLCPHYSHKCGNPCACGDPGGLYGCCPNDKSCIRHCASSC